MDVGTDEGRVAGWPRVLLRAEGAALAAVALVGSAHAGAGWWLFALLLLAPDLSMLAYIAGPRVGAHVYNAVHLTIGPLALSLAGAVSGQVSVLSVGLIWLVHVGVDRALGYGLKYPDRFGHTHLGTIGRR